MALLPRGGGIGRSLDVTWAWRQLHSELTKGQGTKGFTGATKSGKDSQEQVSISKPY
jgi:hypothetical protein